MQCNSMLFKDSEISIYGVETNMFRTPLWLLLMRINSPDLNLLGENKNYHAGHKTPNTWYIAYIHY